MLDKLLSMVRTYEMVQPGDVVICAVSGGADSVALLYAMFLLQEKLGVHLEAAHFNHCLRDQESDRDEAFVRALCHRLDIPLTVGKAQVQPGKKGLEAAAREARYGFFAQLSGKVATAHTADDNAETVLMHMVRGTGLKGLGAIAPVRGQLIRPLLTVTRREVLAFLQEQNLSFVEDSTNQTDAFLRNRIRHHVMPLLLQENPRLAENLSAMALRLREDEQALSERAEFTNGVDVCWLQQMPKARRSRVLAEFLRWCGVKEPEAEHIAQVDGLVFSSNPSAKAMLPGGVTIIRKYDKLTRWEEKPCQPTVTLQCPGVTKLPQSGLCIRCTEADRIENSANCFTVTLQGQPVVRCRQAGDTMRLAGGSKTLKKLFIDKKIPQHTRSAVAVIADDGGVLGVGGIGVNLDRAASTLPAVCIRIEQAEPGDQP